MPSDSPPTILCFNPYVRWSLHSARHSTILHGLHLRGARTLMVLCDGLMTECDLYQPSKGNAGKRTGQSCSRCQAESAFVTAKQGLNYLWLGRWLDPDVLERVTAWAREVEDPTEAVFNAWQLGKWVRSSVHSHYRTDSLTLDDPEVDAVYRRYLISGAIIASAFDALLSHEQPDALLLFNGRMAPTRIALELARQHGVRTITEERGFAPGHMRLVENTHCLDPNPFYDLCEQWRDTPLSSDELKSLKELLDNHLKGEGFEMDLFAAPAAGVDQVAQRLTLNKTKKYAVLFTSSTDEPQGQPEARGVFNHQHDWVRSTIAYFSNRPDWNMIIRTHPNSGGKRSVGTNSQELEFITDLTADLPDNVHVVLPEDDVSSFDLMKLAHCGLIWHSSVGIEMAAMGRPVLRAGNYWFRDADFMQSPADENAYAECVDALLNTAEQGLSTNQVISAWRFTYCWFFRQSIPFPLVRQPDWARGEHDYESLDALQPGRDESLDRVCSIFLDDGPVYVAKDRNKAASTDEETDTIAAFVARYPLP